MPREVLELQEKYFKLQDDYASLEKKYDESLHGGSKQDAQLNALQLFASDIQRRYDRLEHEYNQQKLAFHELTNQDWAKRVLSFKE